MPAVPASAAPPLLSPALLQDLSRRRLTLRRAAARGGVGERPSRARGPGLEFAEFRPYVAGDDIRSLDARASLRSNAAIVREYTVNQQLPVMVALDTSRSMLQGGKFELARSLAAAFAYTALSGGDVVQLARLGDTARLGNAPGLSARLGGQGRATEALAWLAATRPDGRGRVTPGLRAAAPRIPRGALCVVISDFLDADSGEGLRALHARRAEVVAVQVLSPEDLDPALYRAQGPLVLHDAEEPDGEGAVVQLSAGVIQAYRDALAAWTSGLAAAVTRHGGLWLSVRADTPVQEVVRRELLGRGLLT